MIGRAQRWTARMTTSQKERSTRTMDAYCVKCKKKQPLNNAKEVVLKNGRPALKGVCPVCGTSLMRFVKKGS
jgi:hypothetical protein